ncbi:MAG: hypothetical protein J5I91_08600 [Bacteroidetes bacterium]|nr:hypothetical protein [Bacteroidota bacterium]
MKLKLYLITGLAILLFACNNQSKTDYDKQRSLEYIDSLQNTLLEIKSKLDNIDFEEIAHRKQYILSELDFIHKTIKPEQRDAELDKILTDYQGFAMMYENLDRNIERIVKQTEELFIQTKTLRKSVENGDYKKEDFKIYLRDEARDLAQLQEDAEKYLEPVIESNEMFLKRMEKLEEITKTLKKD